MPRSAWDTAEDLLGAVVVLALPLAWLLFAWPA